jgi:ribonuclease P protein component
VASPGRLTRTADLELVRREGKRVRTALLEVRYLASLLHHHRVGIIVPRYKHSAVARNRLKRRLRELTRTTWPTLLARHAPMDLVLRAAPGAYAADYARLATDVQRLGVRVAQEAA